MNHNYYVKMYVVSIVNIVTIYQIDFLVYLKNIQETKKIYKKYTVPMHFCELPVANVGKTISWKQSQVIAGLLSVDIATIKMYVQPADQIRSASKIFVVFYQGVLYYRPGPGKFCLLR